MEIYCLKCERKTPTAKMTASRTKNGKPIVKGVCSVCGTRKAQIVAEKDVKKGGFLFSLLGNLFKPLFG